MLKSQWCALGLPTEMAYRDADQRGLAQPSHRQYFVTGTWDLSDVADLANRGLTDCPREA